MLDEWFLGQQYAIMANQETAIKGAYIKALFHAICTGASCIQDTNALNAALAFKFIQLVEEDRAGMASGSITNYMRRYAQSSTAHIWRPAGARPRRC